MKIPSLISLSVRSLIQLYTIITIKRWRLNSLIDTKSSNLTWTLHSSNAHYLTIHKALNSDMITPIFFHQFHISLIRIKKSDSPINTQHLAYTINDTLDCVRISTGLTSTTSNLKVLLIGLTLTLLEWYNSELVNILGTRRTRFRTCHVYKYKNWNLIL